MEILTYLTNEIVPTAFAIWHNASCFDATCDGVHNSIDLVDCKEVGNVSTRKEIIDVNQEAFVCNLRIGEEEEHAFSLDTSLVVHDLQIILQVTGRVGAVDHNLFHVVATNEGGKSGKTLFPRTSDAHKQCMSPFITNNTNDSGDVLHRIFKENEVHCNHCLVVIPQSIFQHSIHRGQAGNLIVDIVLDSFRKVTEQKRIGILLGVEFCRGK